MKLKVGLALLVAGILVTMVGVMVGATAQTPPQPPNPQNGYVYAYVAAPNIQVTFNPGTHIVASGSDGWASQSFTSSVFPFYGSVSAVLLNGDSAYSPFTILSGGSSVRIYLVGSGTPVSSTTSTTSPPPGGCNGNATNECNLNMNIVASQSLNFGRVSLAHLTWAPPATGDAGYAYLITYNGPGLGWAPMLVSSSYLSGVISSIQGMASSQVASAQTVIDNLDAGMGYAVCVNNEFIGPYSTPAVAQQICITYQGGFIRFITVAEEQAVVAQNNLMLADASAMTAFQSANPIPGSLFNLSSLSIGTLPPFLNYLTVAGVVIAGIGAIVEIKKG